MTGEETAVDHPTDEFFEAALGQLGYPGFASVRSTHLRAGESFAPAELLLLALEAEDLDARVVEALPWLPFQFSDLPWDWLRREAKLRERQNRLGFVIELARQVAEAHGDTGRAAAFAIYVAELECCRLATEDTLCKKSLSQAERDWLRLHRSPIAAHWHLLTDLQPKDLSHVYSETVG